MPQVSASGGGYDPNVDPGPVNPPVIFEPNTALTQGDPQVWVAASGGANWGGCLVSLSFDGVNYDYIGTITSSAYQGVLTAKLAAASGLDTTNTLAIDLTTSEGIFPTAATHADATNYRTLCYVCPAYTTTAPNTGELLAYGAVSATGTYTNALSYLERGLYGTTGASHATGDFFSRIDLGEIDNTPNSIIAYDLPTQYIGATLYLKLQSFNVFGNATEDISTVTEYIYTPSGSGYGGGGGGVPTTPATPVGTPIHNFIALQWAANPKTDNVTGYNVLRALSSGGPYASIGTPASTQFFDTSVTSGTTYYYEIEAVNAAGTSAASAYVAVTAA